MCIKCSLLPFWSHTAWRFSVKGLTVLPLLFLFSSVCVSSHLLGTKFKYSVYISETSPGEIAGLFQRMAEEKAQWLRVVTVLADGLAFIPSTLVAHKL